MIPTNGGNGSSSGRAKDRSQEIHDSSLFLTDFNNDTWVATEAANGIFCSALLFSIFVIFVTFYQVATSIENNTEIGNGRW